MAYKLIIKNPDGDEIELLTAEDYKFIEAAQHGAEALLEVFKDDREIEEGYIFKISNERSPLNPLECSDLID